MTTTTPFNNNNDRYASIIDMPAEVAGEVLKELPRLAKVVKDATGCDGAGSNRPLNPPQSYDAARRRLHSTLF